jgi:transcriptional regulator with XRE-family HTH domain
MATLRSLRVEKGLALREVARQLGIDAGHLSRIERGDAVPSADLAARIAQWYGVSELHVLYPERYSGAPTKPAAA